MKPLTRALGLSALLALSAACFGETPVPKVTHVVETPKTFSAKTEVSGPALEAWCSDFGDAELDAVVSRAFDENLNLRAAWARLEGAAALRQQTHANMWPTLNLDASTSRSLQPFQGLNPITGEAFAGTFEAEQYRASLGAGYEIDLWGRLYAARQAADFDFRAARADVETIALSLTSEIAESWFTIVQQRQKRALIEEQIALNERYLEVLLLRLENGRSTALDVNQQQQQIDGQKTQLELIVSQERQTLARLNTLLGKAPGTKMSIASVALPEVPAVPDVGVPADLLSRRPDLRAASYRLQASNRRIAEAVRNQLPTIRLSASFFLQAFDIASFLDQVLWSVSGQLGAPLFDGGLREAGVKRAKAAQKEALYTYANAMVSAMAEVERAMIAEYHQARFIQQLDAQRAKAEVALQLARDRYQRGALDFLRVLTSLQALQALEQSSIDARRQQLSNRIQLCRALGGSWTTKLQAPQEDPPKKGGEE